MLNQPTSSPMITRMFGLPDGDACCACATSTAVLNPDTAATAVLASSILRRLSALLLGTALSSSLALDISHSFGRMTHLKPRWLVDVSTASAWRAAGR